MNPLVAVTVHDGATHAEGDSEEDADGAYGDCGVDGHIHGGM